MLALSLPERPPASLCRCCGSFLDAPRPHPLSGELARKCVSCLTWRAELPALDLLDAGELETPVEVHR